MTEDEAKQKWCPMMRLTTDQGEWRTNRGERPQGAIGESYVYFNCLGRDCMAWRWNIKPNPDWEQPNPMKYPSPDYRFDNPYIIDEENGYCGLAGKP